MLFSSPIILCSKTYGKKYLTGQYDSTNNRKLVVEKGMDVFIPGRIKEKNLYGKEFRYDSVEDQAICPTGHMSEGKTRQDTGTLHIFPGCFCEGCPFSI